jgi:alpha-beta hydrolase superfamily lysophospholipase
MQALHTIDDLPLHMRQWTIREASRGTVLIVHGLGEHIGRYEEVASHLNTAGWNVAGYDQRGHGASAGRRGAIARADSLLQDLGLVIDTLRGAQSRPLVLLGHSMGGVVAARFVAEGLVGQPAGWWRPVDALVLSSPALDTGMTALQRGLLSLLGPLAPNLALSNGLSPQWVSRDPATVKAYVDDPLVHDRVTPRLARFIVDDGRYVRERAAQWRIPTLLLWAGSDRCVAAAGSEAFAAAAPPQIVSHKRYPALAHEIFNEPERGEVLADLTRWLDARPLHPLTPARPNTGTTR